ncbi:MAG: hypothetical protein AAGU05_10470, partial [Anaerolineaceae bacterium]
FSISGTADTGPRADLFAKTAFSLRDDNHGGILLCGRSMLNPDHFVIPSKVSATAHPCHFVIPNKASAPPRGIG